MLWVMYREGCLFFLADCPSYHIIYDSVKSSSPIWYDSMMPLSIKPQTKYSPTTQYLTDSMTDSMPGIPPPGTTPPITTCVSSRMRSGILHPGNKQIVSPFFHIPSSDSHVTLAGNESSRARCPGSDVDEILFHLDHRSLPPCLISVPSTTTGATSASMSDLVSASHKSETAAFLTVAATRYPNWRLPHQSSPLSSLPSTLSVLATDPASRLNKSKISWFPHAAATSYPS